ncbi:MAG: hypothetical protein HYW24_00825 [Candidatus Aenigmarchaeota archaeon]|nr:hypothetical protein [Candidatus Aenigmarchaeota archaeon]
MNDPRRTKMQIYIDILRAVQKANGKMKKTHIVYKANLTHSRLGEYLNHLMSNEFITEQKMGTQTFYTITGKGEGFLNGVNKLKGIADAFGVPL